MDIVGVTGPKGSGKDTFAGILSRYVGGSEVVSFADRLKAGCMRVFGLSWEDCYTPEGKARVLTKPLYLDDYLVDMEVEFGLQLWMAQKSASTVREIIQYVGTEYVRFNAPNYWTDSLEVPDGTKLAIIPDTRFQNEVEEIRRRAERSLIVKILRIGYDPGPDTHASESGEVAPDITLAVEEGNTGVMHVFAEVVGQLGLLGILQDKVHALRPTKSAIIVH